MKATTHQGKKAKARDAILRSVHRTGGAWLRDEPALHPREHPGRDACGRILTPVPEHLIRRIPFGEGKPVTIYTKGGSHRRSKVVPSISPFVKRDRGYRPEG